MRRSGPSIALFALSTFFLLACCSSESNGPDGDGVGPIPTGANSASPLPAAIPRTTADFLPRPAQPAVGDWVQRRGRLVGSHEAWIERWAVVAAASDGSLWIEESEDRTLGGETIVRARRVDPKGTVHEGYIGRPGQLGEALTLLSSPPLAATPDRVEPEPVRLTVGGEELECQVEVYDYGDWERRVYRSSEVPYDGIVRIEEPDFRLELLAFGRDATAALKRP